MAFGVYLESMRELMVLKRYQNKFMHKRRSVAEHQVSTAMIAQWLCVIEREIFKTNVDLGEVLQRAINYNSTQVIMGNILSTTSRLSADIDNAKLKLKEIVFEENLKPMLPESWRPDFKRFMINAKDDSIEGKVIKCADSIDTLLEALEEINLGNGCSFAGVVEETLDELMHSDLASVDYLIKYVIDDFKIDEKYISDEFVKYKNSIDFKYIDRYIINDFKVVGSYMYNYRKLMDLKRYQNKYMFKRTSVMEHMWFVAKISQGFAIWMEEKFGKKVDMARVLSKAITHDYCEIITGDILSTTKKMTHSMRHAVDEMEEVAFNSNISKLIPNTVLGEYENYILYAKDDTIEGTILKATDIIDTIFECAAEVKLGNVEIFGPILKNVTKSLINVELEVVDYFFLNSLADIGLSDVERYYGKEVFEHLEHLKKVE